jgi:3'-5' exoribonuclease
MKSQFVNELKPGQTVKETFLLTRKTQKEKKGGGSYTMLEFTDRSGSIDGIAWESLSADLRAVDTGDFVHVEGNVNEYNERVEIMVNAIGKLPEAEVEPTDFIAQCEEDIDKVLAEIQGALRPISDPHLSRLIDLFLKDKIFMTSFRLAPAARKAHHAYLGGLAVHTRNILRFAGDIPSVYPSVNADLLLAGGFLHDIGKIHEYSYRKKLETTTRGRMLGHIVIGYEMVESRIGRLTGFPEGLKMRILHMILSHHGELEWGSPTPPLFPEALILHFLDNLDAKFEMMIDQFRKNKGRSRAWSDFHPLLEREIYLGDEA